MDKREKVIKDFEKLREYADSEVHPVVSPDNWCVYSWLRDLIDETEEDALALLKAQEPRVMTLEEVKMLDRDYYYLESMRSPGKELREIVGAYGITCVTWPSITWARQTMGDIGYGKTWRCWTSRPTDEQREAVKWDG